MVAEMRCVTSIYRLELGSGSLKEWYLGLSVVGVPKSYQCIIIFMENIMRQFVYDSWNGVMNAERNPLRHIPHLQTRHMILQILAWVWCATFAQLVGSWYIFGFTAIAHVILLATIVLTVATFETAKRNPNFFLRDGYHTPRRSTNLYYNGKKIKSDPNDAGGEHE